MDRYFASSSIFGSLPSSFDKKVEASSRRFALIAIASPTLSEPLCIAIASKIESSTALFACARNPSASSP